MRVGEEVMEVQEEVVLLQTKCGRTQMGWVALHY